jgi:hypothetical protein
MKARTAGLLFLLALFGGALRAHAAAIAWTGNGDGAQWGDPANWSLGTVPTVADDVLIATDVVVFATPTVAFNVQSLAIGDGASVPTLRIATAAFVVGHTTVAAGGTLLFDTTHTWRTLGFLGQSGSVITHFGPVQQATVAVTISAGSFELEAGGLIYLSGKGFVGGPALSNGFGPGQGARATPTRGAGGAGHGGTGGNGANVATPFGDGGPQYGHVRNPFELGSGGGGGDAPCVGGNGGGLFLLSATTTTINGQIEANGFPGFTGCADTGGGGSGGTINIQTYNMAGSGVFLATGAAGANGILAAGGGGGGGRISLIATGTVVGTPGFSLLPGAGGTGGAPAAVSGLPGQVRIDPHVYTGGGGDGSGCSVVSNWYGNISPGHFSNIVFGSTNPTFGCFWNVVLPFGGLDSITMESVYQGTFTWNIAFTSVTGNFNIQGGTFTLGGNFDFQLGGDWNQTGGFTDISVGSVTFTGNAAQTITQTSGSSFNHLRTFNTAGTVEIGSDVQIDGTFTPGVRFRNTSGGHTLSVGGAIVGDPPAAVNNQVWRFNGAANQLVSTGPYYSVIMDNPNGVTFISVSSPTVGPGDFIIRSGASLNFSNRVLSLTGGFTDEGGILFIGGSTVAFQNGITAVVRATNTVFEHVLVQNPGAEVRWETPSIISKQISLQGTGKLEMVNGATLTLRGGWQQVDLSSFIAGSGAVAFDGTAQQLLVSSGLVRFNNLISSSAVGISVSSDIYLSGDLLLQRGTLDLSSRTVFIEGNLTRFITAPPPLVPDNVFDFRGTATQTIDLSAAAMELSTVVVRNAGGGVTLASALTLGGNFQVSPGALFNGADQTLTMNGADTVWDTVGAVYTSSGSNLHLVEWHTVIPSPGRIFVAGGSTVDARIDISSEVIAQLQGDFNLTGVENSLVLNVGAQLDATGSTITLRGSSDLALFSGSNFIGDAGTWIVYEGSGSDRGLNLSTGPFRNLRFSPDLATATFRLGDTVVLNDLIITTGTLFNRSTATLSLGGDLRNLGGRIFFADEATGTLRFVGGVEQQVVWTSTDVVARFELLSSSSVQLGASDVYVTSAVVLAGGDLRGGSAQINLDGDWLGTGGNFLGETSTVSFSSATPNFAQHYTDLRGAQFHGLQVQSSTMVFISTFTADVLTSTRPSSLMLFNPVSGAAYGTDELRMDGQAVGTEIRLRSAQPGTQFDINVVVESTVTLVDVADSRATGIVIQANDGFTFDSGGTTNWNFLPQIIVLAPGELFTEGIGRGGTPNAQTAGTSFFVLVRAVSDRFRTVLGAAADVAITTTDPYDVEPASQPLVGGQQSFAIDLRLAEPAALATDIAAASPNVFNSSAATVFVQPAAFDRLQLLMPGELAVPGSASGKSGVPNAQVTGIGFSAEVRGTDSFWNIVPSAVDTVVLSTPTAAAVVLPAAAPLVAGSVQMAPIVFSASGTFSLAATDLTNAGITSSTSGVLQIFLPQSSSPTVKLSIPLGATVATLAGGLSGTAFDAQAVVDVTVSLQDSVTGNYFDWTAQTFSLGSPDFQGATLVPPNGQSTDWSVALPDELLTDGRTYFTVLVASNPSLNVSTELSTFVFSGGQLQFNPGDGEGQGVLTQANITGCGPLVTTITYTAGPSGIGRGGAVALRIPDGWADLEGWSLALAPSLNQVRINSLSASYAAAGSSIVIVNPDFYDGVPLGKNWIVAAISPTATNTLLPGESLAFVFHGYPPSGPEGLGNQFFDMRAQSNVDGALVGLSTVPILNLLPGTPAGFAFADKEQIALGPLQTAPTMQILTVDACGNRSAPTVGAAFHIEMGVIEASTIAVDANASLFLEGGAATNGHLIMGAGSSLGPRFYVRTATAGPSAETLRVAGTVDGSTNSADRLILLRTTEVRPATVSIDTGTPALGQTAVAITPGSSTDTAHIRFTLTDDELQWDVVIATETSFTSPLFRRRGLGDPSGEIEVVWDGTQCGVRTCSFVSPGVYFARVRAGAAEAFSVLSTSISASGAIFGRVNPLGGRAVVRAEGPGAGFGSAVQADATGHFVLYGLSAGTTYNIFISTERILDGGLVVHSTRVTTVPAAVPGTDIGTIAISTPSLLRISAGLPVGAPQEIWGRVRARNADGSSFGVGTLHFPAGAARSDDGRTAIGLNGSTWTVIALPADSYVLDVELLEVGLSSTTASVVLPAGGRSDVVLALGKKANVYGFVVVPGTRPYGAALAISATADGASEPAAFSNVFLIDTSTTVAQATAAFSLFGLDPGSWTLQAQGAGFALVSTTVYIASTADVGNPIELSTNPLSSPVLRLGVGGIIRGTLTLTGDSWGLSGLSRGPIVDPLIQPSTAGFFATVTAYDPATFVRGETYVAVQASSTLTSSTFAVTGLPPGNYVVNAQLPGFARDPPGPMSVPIASVGAATNVVLGYVRDASRIILAIDIPAGGMCHSSAAFKSVGLFFDGPGITAQTAADITLLDGVDGAQEAFHCSSMTFTSPPLGTGFFDFELMYAPTGRFERLRIPLTDGTTATARVNLAASTTSVSGVLTLSGGVAFKKNTFTVRVSSVAGLLTHSSTSTVCLLSTTTALNLSQARMELVPLLRERSAPPSSLRTSSSCARYFLASGDRPPMAAYVSELQADGAFDFGGVRPGAYLLRLPRDLDGDPGNGLEAPPLDRLVRVSTSGVQTLRVNLGAGAALSGLVRLPAGLVQARAIRMDLADADGNVVRSKTLQFSQSDTRSFQIDNIADGDYALTAVDTEVPVALVAQGRLLRVSGEDVSDIDIDMLSAGAIRGRIAVQGAAISLTTVSLSGAPTSFRLITHENRELLPPSLQLSAVADPWFQGGFFAAQRESCASGNCRLAFDADGRFLISGVMPGIYTVESTVDNSDSDAQSGALPLSPARRAAVTVDAGRTTDLGALVLREATTLRGRVTAAVDGSAAANVVIEARSALPREGDSPRLLAPRTRSDRDGRFVLRGLDPEVRFYDIVLALRELRAGEAATPFAETRIGNVDIISTPTLNIALPAATLAVSGRAVSSDGTPLFSSGKDFPDPGALVFLRRAGDLPTRNPLGDLALETDTDGQFVVENLVAGSYRLTVTALDHAPRVVAVQLTTASLNLGDILLQRGAQLRGEIRLPSGGAPGEDEIRAVYAATPDLTESFVGTLVKDPNTRTVTGYRLSGFRPAISYRIVLLTGDGDLVLPAEASAVVFSSAAQNVRLDLEFRRPAPLVFGKSRRVGSDFLLEFTATQPLRSRAAADDNLSLILSTARATGLLSGRILSADRRRLSAVYSPGIGESSFTVRLAAFSARPDPDSVDAVNPEFVVFSTFTFFAGLDGYHRTSVPNMTGGSVALEDDAGRVTLPQGAFFADASSTVLVGLQRSNELQQEATVLQTAGMSPAAANIRALRHNPAAYPADLIRAMAAKPPNLSPFSSFYDVLLPQGVRTALARPAQITLHYSSGTDPAGLNVYWYNPAANAYVLEQDVTGAARVVDTVNRTITIHVDHFSTFVLFQTGVSLISGNSFGGDSIEAFNFPNPFDLSVKTVTPIHGVPPQSIRGTMIRLAVPLGSGGPAKVDIFNIAGERVRTLDLGTLSGGQFYYQPWDGRNSSGKDVASGVYIGQVKVGGKSAFIKMALIK